MNTTKLVLSMTLLILSSQTFAQNEIRERTTTPLTIGERIEFHSEILDEKRILNIYLPMGYSQDSLKTYPVIYLLDGSIDEDFIHISGLVQFGSFSWINMIPESIVVGIANVDRKRDFTFPTTNIKDREDFPTAGQSENFIQFIEKELQPLVESSYKADSTKTLIGQSLGGLLAAEILLTRPELFDNYIMVSPSLWWDDESILKRTPKQSTTRKSIYIAVGKEGEVMERTTRALHEKLVLTNKENSNLHFKVFEKQDHGDALHLAVYDAFEKIFAIKEE